MAVDALGPDVDLDRVDVHPAGQLVSDRNTEAAGKGVRDERSGR